MKKVLLGALTTVCLVASASVASATVMVTVSEGGMTVASWEQSEQPVLTAADYVTGNYADVPVFNGTGLGGDSDVVWYDGANGGGLSSYDGDLNILGFTTAFTGPTSAPVFHVGTYYGTDIGDTGNKGPFPAIVTISIPGDASVPEPATWAMMLVGMGMIGVAIRRRQMLRVTYN